MPIKVFPVHSSAERRRFIDFAYSHYADSRYWVPPLRRDVNHALDEKRNPFYQHGDIQLFLAQENGETVGRIAAIKNGMHLQKYNDGNGFFGFFECNQRYNVAEALLDAAARWLRANSLTGMRGPANPSLNDTAGLLVDGFDRRPSILMPYNPPYYEEYFTRWGLDRAMTMWAYYLHVKYVQTEKLKRGAELVMRRYPDLTLRSIDMDRFDEEAEAVLSIYNEAWSENWGHVPMTDAEFDQLGKDLKKILDPELIFILEDAGEPVAFSIAIPNLNQALRYVSDGRLLPTGLMKLLAYTKFGGVYECRMPLMGVRKAYHNKGLFAPLVLATIDTAPKIGYDGCEMSWVLDSNTPLKNALQSMGSVIDKEYAMYEAEL